MIPLSQVRFVVESRKPRASGDDPGARVLIEVDVP